MTDAIQHAPGALTTVTVAWHPHALTLEAGPAGDGWRVYVTLPFGVRELSPA